MDIMADVLHRVCLPIVSVECRVNLLGIGVRSISSENDVQAARRRAWLIASMASL